MGKTDLSMLHFAFIEALAELDNDSSAEWRRLTAALLCLRLLEQWRATTNQKAVVGPSGFLSPVSAARTAIDAIDSSDSTRGVLSSLLAAIVASKPGDTLTIRPRLMAFGRMLELQARWALAVDLYRTVAELCGTTADPNDVAEATAVCTRLGECHRQLAQWDAAQSAYASAVAHASLIGDIATILRNRCYIGSVIAERGNLPAAESELLEVASEADRLALTEVRGIARHSLSFVALLRRDFEGSAKLAFEALEYLRDPLGRERALTDVAAAFSELGLRSVARDALQIVTMTAQEPFVRQTALINLMEIAAMDRMELMFEQYRREIAAERMPPRMAGYYRLYAGNGALAFGRVETAKSEYQQAIQIATAAGLSQLIFETETALSDLTKKARALRQRAPEPAMSGETLHIAEALADMRQQLTPTVTGRRTLYHAGVA